MKRTIGAILSGFVIVVLTVSMLCGLTRLTERKYGRVRLDDFFQEKEDFDILFFGSSHVVQGVFPMELWQDYGIVSYNLAAHGGRLPTAYWTLIQALKHTTPKLVVIDGYYLSVDTKKNGAMGQTHDAFDPLPLSWDKITAVKDIAEDSFKNTGDALELIWDFIVYHDRWSELTSDDFDPDGVEKGAHSYIEVVEPQYYPDPENKEITGEETVGVTYLRKMIEACQENNIEVLLTYLPGSGNGIYPPDANRIVKIGEEYGVNVINFLTTEVINIETDCADNGGHLNPSGGRKVTSYLGQYILEHYKIPDHRDNPAYAGWHKDYEKYTQFKIDSLSASRIIDTYDESRNTVIDFRNYLMLLSDKHLSYCVYLKDNNMWHNGSHYAKLLENAGIKSDALISGEATLAVVDNVEGKTTYLSEGDAADTSFGTVSLVQMEDRKTHVLIDGTDSLDLTGSNIAGAVVIDNATGEAATASKFAVAATSVNKVS